MRAGCRAFPISPRNSDIGVANLLQKMDVRYLFVSKDQAMQKLAASAIERVFAERPDSKIISVYPALSFETLYEGNTDGLRAPPPPEKVDIRSTALILHSSGMSHIGIVRC